MWCCHQCIRWRAMCSEVMVCDVLCVHKGRWCERELVSGCTRDRCMRAVKQVFSLALGNAQKGREGKWRVYVCGMHAHVRVQLIRCSPCVACFLYCLFMWCLVTKTWPMKFVLCPGIQSRTPRKCVRAA